MNKTFSVEVISLKKISEIENAWSAGDYKALLSSMGIDEGLDAMNPGELKEMCLMSLGDYKHDEAAKYVLTHLFREEITEGKIDQLSHQMPDSRLWEEYSDNLFHKRLFDAYGLLREAFNGIFAQPTGVEVTINITSQNKDDFNVFEESPHSSFVRLLSCGLKAGEILNRLFDEQITGDTFEESKGILWEIKKISQTDQEAQYKLISSEFWFGGLVNVSQFEAQTHADAAQVNSSTAQPVA